MRNIQRIDSLWPADECAGHKKHQNALKNSFGSAKIRHFFCRNRRGPGDDPDPDKTGCPAHLYYCILLSITYTNKSVQINA